MPLDTLRSALLGGKLRVVAVVAVVLVGSIGAAFGAGLLGAPSVEGVDNRFGGVTQSTTVIETDLHVHNPNPLGVSLGGVTVEYEVSMNGIAIADGAKEGVSLDAGNSTLSFTTEMDNGKIPAWWASHVRNGERTELVVDANVRSSSVDGGVDAPEVNQTIETDLLSAFNSTETRELDADKEPVIQDPVLYVNETSATWGEVTDDRTAIRMEFEVYNPNDYPVAVSKLGYDIGMNDVGVGEGETDQGTVVGPHERATITATTYIENDNLDDWWVTHLQNDQVTEMRVDFYLVLDLSAAGGGSVSIPLDTMTDTVETDIFGNKNESAGGDGEQQSDGSTDGGAAETDDADGGPDDGTPTEDGTSTATDEESEAETTEAGTTTDDGLL